MKHILSLAFFLICSTFFGQDIKEQLKSINTIEEADIFVNTYKNTATQIIKIIPEIEVNEVFTKRVKGEIFTYENSICKIIESKKSQMARICPTTDSAELHSVPPRWLGYVPQRIARNPRWRGYVPLRIARNCIPCHPDGSDMSHNG